MQTQCGTPPATGLPAHVRTIDPFVILDRMRAREALAAEIKRMVDLLDAIDGDPDLEPSLAGSPSGKHAFDAEGDDCDLEDGRDGEPSLGSFDRLVNQEHSWRRPCHYSFSPDLEADRADDEDGGDTELNGDETDWSDHSSGMDGGIGDGDGLLEQVGCCQLRLDARDTEGVRKAVGRLLGDRLSRPSAGRQLAPGVALIAPRRAFLRGLTTLPLIGGSVALIGKPTAAAVPVTLQLAEAYLGWLRLEHCKLMHEIVDGPSKMKGVWRSHAPASALPRSSDLVMAVRCGPASGRAAVILSAAGVDLATADTSACVDLAERGLESSDNRFDPFGPPLEDDLAFDAYRSRVMNKTGPLLL